jgi:hypothetical protein
MKKERQIISPVDDGISVYDRERVEDVEFREADYAVVQRAVEIFDRDKPRDIFSPRKPGSQEPMEFMLPGGTDPHEPVKHLARACVDALQGFGWHSVLSVDTAKASRFERATDAAANTIKRHGRTGLVGFSLVIIRYEDWPDTPIESLRHQPLDSFKPAGGPSEDEANRLARVDRLCQSVRKLDIPTLNLFTMDPYEAAPILPEVPDDPGFDAGTRLY